MPYIRFKRWSYMTKLAPHVFVAPSGRRYLWTGDDGGAVHVPYRDDVQAMLNPVNNKKSDYEVAWEKHGIAFDQQGKEVERTVLLSAINSTATTGMLNETVTVLLDGGRPATTSDDTSPAPSRPVHPFKQRGRPRKG